MRNHYKEWRVTRFPRVFNFDLESTLPKQIFLFFIVYLLPTLCSFQASFIIHRHGRRKTGPKIGQSHNSKNRDMSSKLYRYSVCDSILFAMNEG